MDLSVQLRLRCERRVVCSLVGVTIPATGLTPRSGPLRRLGPRCQLSGAGRVQVHGRDGTSGRPSGWTTRDDAFLTVISKERSRRGLTQGFRPVKPPRFGSVELGGAVSPGAISAGEKSRPL